MPDKNDETQDDATAQTLTKQAAELEIKITTVTIHLRKPLQPDDGADLARRAENELDLALYKHLMAKVHIALERIQAGIYNTCTNCEKPISPERLEANPTATQCIKCAKALCPRSCKCRDCGGDIEPQRLQSDPPATLCSECAGDTT